MNTRDLLSRKKKREREKLNCRMMKMKMIKRQVVMKKKILSKYLATFSITVQLINFF